jgi:hypothetical protein
MRKFFYILITLSIVLVTGTGHAREGISRSYLKLGYLAGAPTAADLSYSDADGASMEQYIDLSKNNYGLGGQFLFNFKETAAATYRIGVDIGFQKLFSSKLDTGSSSLSFIDEDYDEDKEYDLYLLGVGEYAPASLPVFFQAGLGAHIVHWQWESHHSGKYSSNYDFASGTAVNVGLLLAGGTKLELTPKITIPVMARIDSIIRYGTETTLSLVIGLDYKFGY